MAGVYIRKDRATTSQRDQLAAIEDRIRSIHLIAGDEELFDVGNDLDAFWYSPLRIRLGVQHATTGDDSWLRLADYRYSLRRCPFHPDGSPAAVIDTRSPPSGVWFIHVSRAAGPAEPTRVLWFHVGCAASSGLTLSTS